MEPPLVMSTHILTTKIATHPKKENMAPPKKTKPLTIVTPPSLAGTSPETSEQPSQGNFSNIDEEFSRDLMKQVNRELGDNVMFNLSDGAAPTIVKRWISTGSKQLDYIISNRRDGGLPEGRIVEIQGQTGCHALGDEVMMFDGSLRNIEDVSPKCMKESPSHTNIDILGAIR